MKKKIALLCVTIILTLCCGTTAFARNSLACTPILVAPKLPTVPSVKVELTDGVKQSINKYVQNLKFDVKIDF